MPRNMSFALTIRQFKDRSKTVTRRKGWQFVKPGDVLMGCEKCMGLKPGESIERLGKILVTDARREPLDAMCQEPYGSEEAAKEGFPELSGVEFVAMFCEHMGGDAGQEVTRIEFEHCEPIMRPLRAYACRLRGSEHETIFIDRSPGKAKRRFLYDLDMDIEYTDIRVRVAGAPQTTNDIKRTAEYRGVPFVKAGMRVQVGGDWGVIVGHNESANWDVLFDEGSRYKGQVLNCHPRCEIAYYDEDGRLIQDFRSAA